MAKQMDHLERARREEETPYLAAAWAQRVEEDRLHYEEQQKLFVENHRAAWEVDVVEKKRLSAMIPDKEIFANAVS
jgi:translation initiation factor 3 subunit A